jgi:hypothetical protein
MMHWWSEIIESQLNVAHYEELILNPFLILFCSSFLNEKEEQRTCLLACTDHLKRTKTKAKTASFAPQKSTN